ncbi:hypothetical protein [Hymenobacter glaciei]
MKTLLSERLALHGLLAIFLSTTLFHVLVMVGVIPFALVWGSRLQDHSQMLRFEAVSLTITLLMLVVVGVRAGYVKIRIPPRVMTVFFGLMCLLFLVNTAGNLASNNPLEQLLFTPLTLLLALLSLRVALGSVRQSSRGAGREVGVNPDGQAARRG